MLIQATESHHAPAKEAWALLSVQQNIFIVQSVHIPLAGSVGVTTVPEEQLSRGLWPDLFWRGRGVRQEEKRNLPASLGCEEKEGRKRKHVYPVQFLRGRIHCLLGSTLYYCIPHKKKKGLSFIRHFLAAARV